MLKVLRYFTLATFFLFSLGVASTEFHEQPYSPRPLRLKRPSNFLNLTSLQIASIILDGETSSGTDIPQYGKYRLAPSSFNEDALRDFLLATDAQDVVILQAQKEKDSNKIFLEVYKWNTEKDLDINHFFFTICKVPQEKLKKKLHKN